MYNILNILSLLNNYTFREQLLIDNYELDQQIHNLQDMGTARLLADNIAGKLHFVSKLRHNLPDVTTQGYNLGEMRKRINDFTALPDLKLYITQLQNTYNGYVINSVVEPNVPPPNATRNPKAYPTPPNPNGRYLTWHRSGGNTTARLMVYENNNWLDYTASVMYEPEHMAGNSLGMRTMQNCLKLGYIMLNTVKQHEY